MLNEKLEKKFISFFYYALYLIFIVFFSMLVISFISLFIHLSDYKINMFEYEAIINFFDKARDILKEFVIIGITGSVTFYFLLKKYELTKKNNLISEKNYYYQISELKSNILILNLVDLSVIPSHENIITDLKLKVKNVIVAYYEKYYNSENFDTELHKIIELLNIYIFDRIAILSEKARIDILLLNYEKIIIGLKSFYVSDLDKNKYDELNKWANESFKEGLKYDSKSSYDEVLKYFKSNNSKFTCELFKE